VSTGALDASGSAWDDCLDRIVRASSSTYLILLVRPSGVATFNKALAQAKNRKKKNPSLDIGYDPVHSAGPIRFRRSEEDLKS
jgi:hypothetical protein